jgi:hypothetical protein
MLLLLVTQPNEDVMEKKEEVEENEIKKIEKNYCK